MSFKPIIVLLPCAALVGCASPYHQDRLAATGGALGAVTGAVVGHQLGHTGGGAVVGGAVGALAGSSVGASIDETEARNRAVIESRIGRPLPAGGATIDDLIVMTQHGVSEEVIVTHIHSNGMAQRVGSPEIIRMQESGVSPRVMQAAQNPPAPVAVASAPPPPSTVIVHEPYYAGPPCYHPHWRYHHFHHRRHCRPRPGWSVSVGGHH